MANAAFNIQSFFESPLVDLATINPAMQGVYSPTQELGKKKIGVTKQFLDDAETYHQKYNALGYYRYLLNIALQRIGTIAPDVAVLDIGSGSGNSVLPCLELLPGSHIVATDISENLLTILLRYIDANPAFQGRVVPICIDATNETFYKPASFDLAIGAAILHHLIDPSTAIRAVGKALKPGGHAIFFEPFENGFSILRLAYNEILHTSGFKGAKDKIAPEAEKLFKALNYDYQIRTGSDKSAAIFRKIDDKWLFTKSYLEEQGKKAGFREVAIYPINNIEIPFTRQTEVNLKLGANLPPEAMPAWAWEILRYYDNYFSTELKNDLLLEGCIIMKK